MRKKRVKRRTKPEPATAKKKSISAGKKALIAGAGIAAASAAGYLIYRKRRRR